MSAIYGKVYEESSCRYILHPPVLQVTCSSKSYYEQGQGPVAGNLALFLAVLLSVLHHYYHFSLLSTFLVRLEAFKEITGYHYLHVLGTVQ